jgi:hypothetical protein
LRPKASLKRWLGSQVAWLALQVDLAYTPSRIGLYSKLPKGGTLCPKVLPPLCDNFLKASRTKINTVIYNQELNLRLNRMLKGYIRGTYPQGNTRKTLLLHSFNIE